MATLTPQDPSYVDTAPVQAEGSAVVDGTPAEVWAVLVDHPGWPRWFGPVKRARATSDPATGVGSTREVVLAGGARFQERFVVWDEPEVWAFTGTEMTLGAFRSLVERATIVELSPGRTRVTYRMGFDPVPLLKPLAPLVAMGVSRSLTTAMEALGREVQARRTAD